MITTSCYKIAARYLGVAEIAGPGTNPTIEDFLMLDNPLGSGHPLSDEIPWCSAFANKVAWLLNLPRSKSWAARSWLKVGTAIDLEEAVADCDVVILKRGTGAQPGPEVISAPGHVGFYAGRDSVGNVLVLGGNQGDKVSIKPFPIAQILGVRRLA